MLLTVTTYGNKNGKKAVVPLSGIYGKLDEEQPEKKLEIAESQNIALRWMNLNLVKQQK